MDTAARVISSWAPTPTTHAIRLERPDHFRFAAGQHVMLQLETDEGVDDRFLSIASSPTRNHIEFAVRLSDSNFKKAFRRLSAGDEVGLAGPAGRFLLEEGFPAVLLSGGIGITPIKSMIEYATDTGLPSPLVLLYGNRSPQEIVFVDEIDRLAKENANLKIAYTVDDVSQAGDWSGRTGRIDASMVREEVQRLDAPVFYACGPPGMVASLTRLLADLGIDKNRVRTENFEGY
ncbi:MAG: ferredoxin--NADP reductase [Methanobacteriota archaeon]